MWERVRFLPAGVMGDRCVSEVLGALTEVVSASVGRSPLEDAVAASVSEVERALSAHRGSDGETCVITRDAVFDLVSRLCEAAESLFALGRLCAALALEAVSDRLLATITEGLVAPV